MRLGGVVFGGLLVVGATLVLTGRGRGNEVPLLETPAWQGKAPEYGEQILLSTAHSTSAQNVSTTVPLTTAQYKLNRLAPGQTSGEAVFALDQGNSVRVEIIANIEGLITHVVGPAGQVVDANTVDGLGGSFTVLEEAPLTALLSCPH